MTWASSLKRKAHPIEIDGNSFFVRALTGREWDHAFGLADESKDEQLLRYGVCDEHGAPVIPEGEDLNDLPGSIRYGLIVEIVSLSIPSKKNSIKSIASSGDSANGGASANGS